MSSAPAGQPLFSLQLSSPSCLAGSVCCLQGVRIPTLGSFDTIPERLRVRARELTVQRPVFRLARNLADAHQLTDDKAYLPGELSAYSPGSSGRCTFPHRMAKVTKWLPSLSQVGELLMLLKHKLLAVEQLSQRAPCVPQLQEPGALKKLPRGKQDPGTCSAAGSRHSSTPCPLLQGIPESLGAAGVRV